MNWRLAYAVGFHPWEDAIGDPPFAETFSRLLDREEEGREPPYGPALDLGTGSGIWGVELAGRGWQVTGVDIVGKALRHARERIRKAGVEMRLVQGNVAKLRAAGIGRLPAGTHTSRERVRRKIAPGPPRLSRRAQACGRPARRCVKARRAGAAVASIIEGELTWAGSSR
jgi:hypothetical protein